MQGVSVNGAMHWIFYYDVGDDWGVVAQSLTTGNCSSLALPAFANEFPDVLVMLGVWGWGECLCVYFCDVAGCMNVWVMKEYGVAESWTKVVNVPLFIGRKIHLEIVIRCIVIDAEDGGVLPCQYVKNQINKFVPKLNQQDIKEYGVAESWTKVVHVPFFIARDINLEKGIRYIVIEAEDGGGVLPYVPHTDIVTYVESFVSPYFDVVAHTT
ncbi:uncharacterized protein [Henckelia pumila]|uniref:uncharacterized protein n=1 Tax=Henckelia pumila TaxID=405737 RepID=UPI003C6E6BFC